MQNNEDYTFENFKHEFGPRFEELRNELTAVINRELQTICDKKKADLDKDAKGCQKTNFKSWAYKCRQKIESVKKEISQNGKYKRPELSCTIPYEDEYVVSDSFNEACDQLDKKFKSLHDDVVEKILANKWIEDYISTCKDFVSYNNQLIHTGVHKKSRRLKEEISDYIQSYYIDFDKIVSNFKQNLKDYANTLFEKAKGELPEDDLQYATSDYLRISDVSYYDISDICSIYVPEIKKSIEKISCKLSAYKIEDDCIEMQCKADGEKKVDKLVLIPKAQEEVQDKEKIATASEGEYEKDKHDEGESLDEEKEKNKETENNIDKAKDEIEINRDEISKIKLTQIQSDENKSENKTENTEVISVLGEADCMASDIKHKKFSIASIVASSCLGLLGVLFLPKIALLIGLTVASLSAPVVAICAGAVLLTASAIWFRHLKKDTEETKKDITQYLKRQDVGQEEKKKVSDRLNELGLKRDFENLMPALEITGLENTIS